MAIDTNELAQALADLPESLDVAALVQALTDMSEGNEKTGEKIAKQITALADGLQHEGNAAVVEAINQLREDLRQRAFNTEIVLTPTYNQNGDLTSARMRRVPVAR